MSPEVAKFSLIEAARIPNEFGVAVLLIALVLLLAPYLSGHDFGILKVPKFTAAAKRNLRYLGPLILSLAVLLYLPIWRATGEAFVHCHRHCNTDPLAAT